MTSDNLPAHHKRQTQPTLYEFIGEDNARTYKEETQPETRPTREGELRVCYQNIHGIKPTTREWGESKQDWLKTRLKFWVCRD